MKSLWHGVKTRSASPWVLVVIMVLAFGTRLGANAVLVGLGTPPPPGSDASEYDTYAWNLAQGRGYRGLSVDVADHDHFTAYRTPAPVLYYAAIFRVAGHWYPAVHLTNAMLAALTVGLVDWIGRRCFGNVLAGRLAALLYACYPFGIYLGLGLLSEVFAAFLVCLLVACALHIDASRGLAWSAALGLVFGVLLLSKPGFIFLVPLLPVWAWTLWRWQWSRWLRLLPMGGVTWAVLVPWVVRNWLVLGAFIPFGTSGGQLLLCTNNRVVVGDPDLYGYSIMDRGLPEYRDALETANDEVRRDALAKQFAVQWLRANPDKWFYLVRSKVLRLWTPRYHGTDHQPLAALSSLYYALILAGFVGALPWVLVRWVRQRDPATLMPLLILATTGMAMVFHGQHRYRFPIDSLCIILASGAYVYLFEIWLRGELGTALAGLGGELNRRRALLAGAALIALTWIVVCIYDNQHMEAYRDRECRDRLEGIGRALAAYRADHGGLPGRLADLVPAYLPNMDRLHCPKHSVSWHDYSTLLGEPDPERAGHLISYALQRAPGAGEPAWVVETHATHFGASNAITGAGALRRVAGNGTAAGSRASQAETQPEPTSSLPVVGEGEGA